MEITISLRPELMPQLEAAAQRSGQAITEFLAQLVEDALAEPYDEELERLLLEGLDSGPATPMTKGDWDEIRQQGLARIARQQTS